MLVLVDGYNITMRDPGFSTLSKQGQRDALVQHLRAQAPTLAPKGQVVVVFDAREYYGRSTEMFGPVKAAYAPDADDEIVRRCGAAKGSVIVYTDDMRLRMRISQDIGRHVEYRDASSLFASRRTPRNAGDRSEQDLPSNAGDITRELADLWLDEDDDPKGP